MSFLAALSRIVRMAKSDIQAIGDFATDAEGMLKDKQIPKPSEPFTPSEIEQLNLVIEAMREVAEGETGKSRTIEFEGAERVANLIFQVAVPIKHQSFLAEMALSYLMAHQEAFIKDYLLQVLIHKRELLISNATFTYEELASHQSIRSLWAVLARKEVEALGYGSIDDVAQYFSKKLGIDLTVFQHWIAIREHSYRRNLIIHNRGHINETYRKKMGSSEQRGHLVTDMEYVASAVKNLRAFIDFIHSRVASKFKLRNKASRSENSTEKGDGKRRKGTEVVKKS